MATPCASRAPVPAGTIPPLAIFRAVAGGYFEAMGIRLLRGRGIDRGDVDRSEPVVVVNEALAKRFFPTRIRSASAWPRTAAARRGAADLTG